jgi:hypothetical protein
MSRAFWGSVANDDLVRRVYMTERDAIAINDAQSACHDTYGLLFCVGNDAMTLDDICDYLAEKDPLGVIASKNKGKRILQAVRHRNAIRKANAVKCEP